MAKKKAQPSESTSNPAGKGPKPNGKQGESIAGYFRKVFKENPSWLRERSNDKLMKRWIADHPDEVEVSPSVKSSLSNLKSVLRSKKRKRVARVAQQSQPATQTPQVKVARVPTGGSKLEALELQIDECLISARHLDRDGLHDVIAMLRRARNAVVWKLGQ